MQYKSDTSSQSGDVYPEILVVGMSRTGTSSIKSALEILFHQPVYHGSVILKKPTHLKFWSKLSSGSINADNDADWAQLLKGYVAVTDLPAAYYFEALIEAFPNAKVILSVRDEQVWTDSYCRLIKAGQRFRMVRFLPPINRVWFISEQMHLLIFGKRVVDGDGVDRAAVLDGYRRHNARVKEQVPADRLLVFDVSQGWNPLCDFLEKKAPDCPFPFLNAGAEGPTRMLVTSVVRFAWIPIMVLGVISLILFTS